MFGFGTMFCVLCDHRLSKRDVLALSGRRDVGVCVGCLAKWQEIGAPCRRCKLPVRGEADLGLFLDRYALGHRDCGATGLFGVPIASHQAAGGSATRGSVLTAPGSPDPARSTR
jgi:hypothetical protein